MECAAWVSEAVEATHRTPFSPTFINGDLDVKPPPTLWELLTIPRDVSRPSRESLSYCPGNLAICLAKSFRNPNPSTVASRGFNVTIPLLRSRLSLRDHREKL